jgi:hypothetical protein
MALVSHTFSFPTSRVVAGITAAAHTWKRERVGSKMRMHVERPVFFRNYVCTTVSRDVLFILFMLFRFRARTLLLAFSTTVKSSLMFSSFCSRCWPVLESTLLATATVSSETNKPHRTNFMFDTDKKSFFLSKNSNKQRKRHPANEE